MKRNVSGVRTSNIRPLTKCQVEVLVFIKDYLRENRRPPVLKEICEHFGYSSVNAAAGFVNRLERAGYITKRGGSRGIFPTSKHTPKVA